MTTTMMAMTASSLSNGKFHRQQAAELVVSRIIIITTIIIIRCSSSISTKYSSVANDIILAQRPELAELILRRTRIDVHSTRSLHSS